MPISAEAAKKVARDIVMPLGHDSELAIAIAASLIVRAVSIDEAECAARELLAKVGA